MNWGWRTCLNESPKPVNQHYGEHAHWNTGHCMQEVFIKITPDVFGGLTIQGQQLTMPGDFARVITITDDSRKFP